MTDRDPTTDTSTTALVIGASGSFGGAVARELVARGWDVRALRRPGGRPPDVPGVSAVEGDAERAEDVLEAMRGVGVLVHAYNVPYQQWRDKLLPVAENVAQAAEREGALIVFPGNVYGLGADFTKPLTEACTHDAVTIKGQLRNQVEARLQRATRRGARLLIIRCGDYFGPSQTHTSWFGQMTKGTERGKALTDPAQNDVPHEWAYLPDVAVATAELLARRGELAANEVFHFSSYQVTSSEMLEAIQHHIGQRRVKGMPWRTMRWLSPFVPFIREALEMRYLWQKPVLLDDHKLRAFLPQLQRTPLREAVGRTLQGEHQPASSQQHAAGTES